MKNIENNKLIAEFMGGNFKITHSIPNEETARVHEGIFSVDELKYHSDWNWLMEVVDKIESLDYTFYISRKDATVLKNHGAIYQSLVYKVDGLNKMQATYKTVVEFIKWYNLQNS